MDRAGGRVPHAGARRRTRRRARGAIHWLGRRPVAVAPPDGRAHAATQKESVPRELVGENRHALRRATQMAKLCRVINGGPTATVSGVADVIDQGGRGRPSGSTTSARSTWAWATSRGPAACRAPTRTSRSGGTLVRGAHNSTAIEGNPLALKEVRTLLEEGAPSATRSCASTSTSRATHARPRGSRPGDRGGGGVGPRGRGDPRRAAGVAAARAGPRLDAAPPDNPPLDRGSRRAAGGSSTSDPFPDGITPPPWTEVDARVGDWLGTAGAGPAADEHLLAYLARVHNAFERIHPFRDGNGRAGRLLLNMRLVRKATRPLSSGNGAATSTSRPSRADNDDFAPLAVAARRAVEESLDRSACPTSPGRRSSCRCRRSSATACRCAVSGRPPIRARSRGRGRQRAVDEQRAMGRRVRRLAAHRASASTRRLRIARRGPGAS